MIAVRAVLNRLRFIAILLGIGAFIAYWDSIKLHSDRWMHPRTAAVRELPQGQEFFCPMDPQVVQDAYQPNGDVPNCPICGMPLVLHAKGQTEELPPGVTGRVTLSPDRVQMAGIQTVAIQYRPIVKHIKTVGEIIFDETGLSQIVSRVGGYVENSTSTKAIRRSTREIRWPRSTARRCIAPHERWSSRSRDRGARHRGFCSRKAHLVRRRDGGHRPHDRFRCVHRRT